ncbi:hypothetical protein GIB67_034471, partial [Kingdonia uniflora]
QTNLQAGADHKFEVILIGLIFTLITQSLAANLGVTTGKHLSEICKLEYPRYVNYCLWLLAEIVVIVVDIPEVIGATGATIALFGALIMPHNLFLHYAIVLLRKIPQSASGINNACRYFLIERGFVHLVAFLINVAVISVSGDVCSSDNLTTENKNQCSNLNLNSASFLLENVLRRSSLTIYVIVIPASGQSSTITGAFESKDEDVSKKFDDAVHCYHPQPDRLHYCRILRGWTTHHRCFDDIIY